MFVRLSLYAFGVFIKFFGILMLVPLLCALVYGESEQYHAFLLSSLITTGAGYFIAVLNKSAEEIKDINRKTGFLVVSLCWLGAGIFGALPYLLTETFSSPADAFFEAVSGFTTTGASVIPDLTSLPRSILFWRDFTQWLGGMGIVLLGIAILPRLSVGGMQIMGLEAPGPTTEKLTPKIAETAKKLWAVYVILSLILVVLLFLEGMPLYDSILNTFGTMSTGGFSPNSASIGGYNNVYFEITITVFMFLAGVNFVLHFCAYKGNLGRIIRSSELKFYCLLVVIFIVISTQDIWGKTYPDFWQSLRYSSFQVISILTTTGFATADFNLWPPFTSFLLLLLMFLGGCSGSTSGSIKMIRILVLVKKGYKEIKNLIYPRGVFPVRIDGKPVDESIISGITSFFLLYIFIAGCATLILLILQNGISIITAFSACAATLGNIGPGLEQVGPMENFSFFNVPSKFFLSLLMLIGRLELYAILVVLTPAFWKR